MATIVQIVSCLFLHVMLIELAVSSTYVTYIPGTMPVILSAPHGGYLKPGSIPPREDGCYNAATQECDWTHGCGQQDSTHCGAKILRDSGTKELTLKLYDELHALTGFRPYVIVNELHRSRLDANREEGEAAQGIQEAEDAYNEYHDSVNQAKIAVGTGILLDMHGQVHPEKWIELGYLISKSKLDAGILVESDSSIRSVSEDSPLTFEEILRGSSSFGATLESYGVSAEFKKIVPSETIPSPLGGNYYSGGYITKTHGSRDGGDIDAIQVESPKALRKDAAKRILYAKQISKALLEFLNTHYGTNY